MRPNAGLLSLTTETPTSRICKRMIDYQLVKTPLLAAIPGIEKDERATGITITGYPDIVAVMGAEDFRTLLSTRLGIRCQCQTGPKAFSTRKTLAAMILLEENGISNQNRTRTFFELAHCTLHGTEPYSSESKEEFARFLQHWGGQRLLTNLSKSTIPRMVQVMRLSDHQTLPGEPGSAVMIPLRYRSIGEPNPPPDSTGQPTQQTPFGPKQPTKAELEKQTQLAKGIERFLMMVGPAPQGTDLHIKNFMLPGFGVVHVKGELDIMASMQALAETLTDV